MDKMIIMLLTSIILSSCSEHIQIPNDGYINSYLQKVYDNRLSRYKSIHDKSFLRDMPKTLSRLDHYLYGKDLTKIELVKDDKEIIEAIPNNTILITTGMLELGSSIFTEEEMLAVLCHESAHIVNDDWKKKIISLNKKGKLDYKVTIRFDMAVSSSLGYKTAKMFNKNLTEDEYKENVKNSIQANYSSSINNKKNIISEFEDSITYDITDSQNFPLEVEYKADKFALNCLSSMGYEKRYLISALDKLYMSPFLNTDKVRLKKRLDYISQTIGEQK